MDPPFDSAGANQNHRLRQQRVVADLGTQALEGTDLDDLFREAVTAVATTLETDSCKILELQPGNDEFLLREGIGWSDGLLGTATVSTDRDSQAGYTLEVEDTVVVDDLRTEDRFAGPELLREHDLVSGISVVIGSADDPWGVLGTHATAQRAYDEGDAVFLRNVANVLASAIERDRADRRRDAEAMLRQKIVDTSPIGITIVGENGELRFANDRAEEIFGRSRERISELEFDDPAWDEIGPDGDPLTAEELPFPRIVESGEPLFDQVSGVLRPNGERIWISVNGAPLWNDNGNIDGVVFAIEDVTDRFHRDRKLERYETIVETAHDGIYVLDEERRFELVNDAFAELTAFSRSELRGSHASLVFGEEFASTEAQQLEAASAPESPTFEETIETGPDETLAIENRFTILPVDDGTGTKRVGVVRDISERKHLEAELRAERDLKDRILETSPIGITLIDADGMNVFANDRAEELFGRSLEELRSYVHDDDRWNLVDEDGRPLSGEELPFTTVKETGEPVYGDVLGLDQPDGTRVWLSAHCGPLFDADGTFDGAVYALRDITERKRLENELERTLDRVSDAFNSIDTDWNFTYVNDHAKELLDVEDRELVGTNVWEEFPSAVGSRFEEEYRRAMDTQETVRFEEYSPVADAWLEVAAYPSESGLSVYFRDITDRKDRERALEESEQRYRTLIDHFPNGAVALFDDDLQYTIVGGELIDEGEYTPDEIVGMSVGEWGDEIEADFEPKFRAALAGEEHTFEVDYEGRELLVYTLPVRNNRGEVFAGMMMVQDITERNEYRRKLEESNERLEQFASVASHDLQEPLRMVSSYLSLIENRYGEELDADGQEFLEYAVDGAERMRAMIDGLLEFSRVETRGEPLEPVELDDVFEDVRKDLAVRIEESEAEIEADSLPRVVGDSDQLRQVFQNLLSNAIEYSGDAPPRIDISAHSYGDRCEIEISDDGIGIDPADADRIFGLFNRLHTVDEASGSGIGLALCERIVERHGGEIRVDSEPGEGSTFSVTLPTADKSAER
ncbi:PAS domain S-box protein [Natronorubrum sp. JWXQ-INN-674]|uniref:histidine kinase n=1 Tax=Natronorubrum halalkaliphilum TaxID=2691917 RepID=A0A6B0VRI6_9EURY|nr:PAS domain S-box protein [Natronorubrum halalkaliphilum]MXV64138.1 PAS domain S-box protein [Natronorubrum halalkaliphilum]